METDPTQQPTKWFEEWRNVIFRPTIQTFTKIVNGSNVGVKNAIIWMAAAMIVSWFIGPQRPIFWGWFVDNFSFMPLPYFYIGGALAAAILGVIGLLFIAAVAHGAGQLLDGEGKYKQLVYSRAILQLPFIILIGLVSYLPTLFFRSHESTFSTGGMIVQVLTLVLVVGILLYLNYVQIVAFSAVEKFRLGKGIGTLLLVGIILGGIGYLISLGIQSLLSELFRL